MTSLTIFPKAGRSMVTAAVLAFLALSSPSVEAGGSDVGILLLAHGGKPEWNDRVNTVAATLDREAPVEVAFGMATRPAIQSAVERLIARGVSRIVAVPLFVSSHSSVITSTAYLLGQRAEMPPELPIFARMTHHHGPAADHHAPSAADNLRPVESTVPITMTEALNSHPLVAEILRSRAEALSEAPEREALVLVAHGPVSDDENTRWLVDMRSLAGRIGAKSSFASIDYLTVRDDAPPEIRSRAAAELRALVERRTGEGRRVLIVPLLLTYGGIEQGIRKRLEGLECTISDRGLLPDERIAEWVREVSRCAQGASSSAR